MTFLSAPHRHHTSHELLRRPRLSQQLFTNDIFLALLAIAIMQTGCAPTGSLAVDAPSLDSSLDTPSADEVNGDDEPLGQNSLSNEALIGLLPGYKYRGEGFRLVNPEPFISTVSPTKTVSLWISEGSYDAFTRIDPDSAGSLSSVPEGTVIVREVLNASVLETITVMAKLREGSFPLGGDFWYASADPDGSIRIDDNGAPLAGLLQNCGTCHLRRNRDGFLFGAPGSSLP